MSLSLKVKVFLRQLCWTTEEKQFPAEHVDYSILLFNLSRENKRWVLSFLLGTGSNLTSLFCFVLFCMRISYPDRFAEYAMNNSIDVPTKGQ